MKYQQIWGEERGILNRRKGKVEEIMKGLLKY